MRGAAPHRPAAAHPQAGVKDTENRVALHALTRPPALLLLAAASSGLRFVLASFALALLLPVFLAVAALKLGLRARWGSLPPPGGLGGPWVAVRGSGDVCGVLALEPGTHAGDGARVTRLSVSRWHRRRGVGKRLLAFAECRARAWAGAWASPARGWWCLWPWRRWAWRTCWRTAATRPRGAGAVWGTCWCASSARTCDSPWGLGLDPLIWPNLTASQPAGTAQPSPA